MNTNNANQAEFWTTVAGEKWVRLQKQIDQTFLPITRGMFARAAVEKGTSVLDIGCGTGASTGFAADRVGPMGRVLGVDISPTMLELAQARMKHLNHVSLIEADAAFYTFENAAFDGMVSRFGLMFFADPLAAFCNIATALKPGAWVSFATWAQTSENPWFMVPARAAKEQLGAPPAVDPDAPGPFAFRDADRVSGILAQAGFQDIHIETTQIELTPTGTAVDAAALSTNLGPAMRTVDYFQGTQSDIDAISDRTAQEFAAFEESEGVNIPALVNFCTARWGGRHQA